MGERSIYRLSPSVLALPVLELGSQSRFPGLIALSQGLPWQDVESNGAAGC